MRALPIGLAIVLLYSSPLAATPGKDYELARLMSREGKLGEAVESARAAVAKDPGDLRAARLLQDLLIASGDDPSTAIPADAPVFTAKRLAARALPPKQGEQALKKLLTQEGVPALVRLDLAIVQIDLEKPNKAQVELKAYLEKHPTDAEACYLLGLARYRGGSNYPARTALGKAIELEPGWAPPTVLLATLHRDADEPVVSRKLLTAALKIYPKNPELLWGLVDDQVSADDLTEAGATLLILAELHPKDGEVFASLADVQCRLGKYEAAEASARKAIELDPEDADARRTLGFVLEKKRDFAGALEQYEVASKLDPEWVQLRIDIGFMHYQIGDLAKAIAALEKALKLDKGNVEAHLQLGGIFFEQKKYRDAKKHIAAVLKRDSGNLSANRYMGRVLLWEGKARDAIKHFEKAAKLDPSDADSVRMIGKALLTLGKLEEALERLSEAVDRDPKDPWAHMDLGKGLEEQEEWDAAEESYRNAIEVDPELADPYFYLAVLLDEVQVEKKEALEHYKRYLELGGEDDDGTIQARVKKLEKK